MLVRGYVHGVAGLDVESFVEGGELAKCAVVVITAVVPTFFRLKD